MTTIKSPKKLIEVALPLDAINVAAAREKSIRHGHPSTLHLWWARRPLAAARAVIFGQLVNDPGYQQGGGFKYGKNKKEAAAERKRLFGIIEELVKWENTTNEDVLGQAREEIRRSWREVCELNKDHPQAAELFNPDKMPGLHDPFAGGGTIPLEAQRLGLEAFASDLNPVAVLINKAMIEIPPKFAGRPPVHPKAERRTVWKGAEGLAEDVRCYGAWMREEAEKRIGQLYPKVEITKAMAEKRPDLKPLVGQKLTVIAWLWARTVKSPNPAFSHVDVPLVSTFVLSTKADMECYVEPVVKGDKYRFEVRVGKPPEDAATGTTAGKRAAFRCLMSGVPVDYPFIRSQGQAGKMDQRLMAIVAEGESGRAYLSPNEEAEQLAAKIVPAWRPDVPLPDNPRDFKTPNYGLTTYADLFTPRQLVALTTFSDLVSETRTRVESDALAAGFAREVGPQSDASSYANGVATMLAFTVSRLADRCSSICLWDLRDGQGRKPGVRNVFSRQAVPMTWDYAEANPMSEIAASVASAIWRVSDVLDRLPSKSDIGCAELLDATTQVATESKVVSTDPPYYDNIGYADLSDFFYVWLRRSLKPIFPSLFATVAVPKAEELVATPYRHGTKEKAEFFFLEGMTAAMHRLAEQAHPAAPVTIYYAFKQSESKDNKGTSNTGWETFLEAVLRAGFALTGTWPMRTELSNRMLGSGNNALASSIVLVCRKRSTDATTVSRREFLRELNLVLPEALDEMTKGTFDESAKTADGQPLPLVSPVAPVDLSQAIIGPGMAVFSKYAAVLEADGEPMKVKTALQLINRFLAEDDFDHDTQFCLHWFDQYGWGEGAYGEADVLARAKATSVAGLVDAGVVKGGSGKVRLLRPNEYLSDWNPKTDNRTPIWEALHQLIRCLRENGETGAGQILAVLKPKSEAIRQLAYRLYTLCERRGQAEDARAYNELVTTWSAIETASTQFPESNEQLKLFGGSS